MTNRLLCLIPLMVVAACQQSAPADPVAVQKQADAEISRPDPRLPAGFTILTGSGTVEELDVASPPTGGTIVTFSIIAPPRNVVQFYERQATAAGMAVDGRLDAGEVLSYEARKAEGSPKTFGATATRKGEYTNVVLNFDVTR